MNSVAPENLVTELRSLQEALRRAIELGAKSIEALARVVKDVGGDIIYEVDVDVEGELIRCCEQWCDRNRVIMVAEGWGEGGRVAFPPDTTTNNTEFYLIVDPIDGTRPLMYDKRSAWSLAAIVPNTGKPPRLRDAIAASMTELPTSKQLYADCLYTIRGRRPKLIRRRLDTGEEREIPFAPSTAATIEHGFAMLTNFFPGGKEMVSAIEEELVRELGGLRAGRSIVFTDQYLSTGGQWYELIVGHDRFNGDLRGRMIERGIPAGAVPGLAGHPYDCCVELIAREAGVIITDLEGRPFDAPLDIESPMSWLGYANPSLRDLIEPVMRRLLRKHGLID